MTFMRKLEISRLTGYLMNLGIIVNFFKCDNSIWSCWKAPVNGSNPSVYGPTAKQNVPTENENKY